MSRLLLLIEHKENRRVLADWLAMRHTVLAPDTDRVVDEPFDLCTLDGRALDRLWAWVQARRAAEQPVFLPFLLVGPHHEATRVACHLWQSVDEWLVVPVRKVELQARVEILLRVRRLSRQNQLILQSAGDGICGVDRDGRVTFVNEAAARMTGYAVEALMGQPLHDVLHHTKPDGTAYRWEDCPMAAALQDGAVRHVANEVVWRKDGTSFVADYVSTPIREDGEVVGAVVSFRDSTERLQLEAERTEKARLEGVLLAARTFEHELNNKLVTTVGYAQVLSRDPALPPHLRQRATEALEGAKEAVSIIRQLLQVTSIQEKDWGPVGGTTLAIGGSKDD